MSDVFWNKLPETLTAVTALLAVLGAAWRSWRAEKAIRIVDKKTDAQTAIIQEVKTAAQETVVNTNGRLDKATEQVKEAQKETVQALKDHVDQLAEMSKAASRSGGRRADDARHVNGVLEEIAANTAATADGVANLKENP